MLFRSAKKYANENGYEQIFNEFDDESLLTLASDKSTGAWIDAENLEELLISKGFSAGRLSLALELVINGDLLLSVLLDRY